MLAEVVDTRPEPPALLSLPSLVLQAVDKVVRWGELESEDEESEEEDEDEDEDEVRRCCS